MHQKIYERLVILAREEKLTTYSEIAPLDGLSMNNQKDRDAISDLLAEIARHEESEGRPMLTALVVHAGGDNNPGEGFFSIAKEFGRHDGSRDPIKRLEFWVNQVKEVHTYWRG